MHYSLWSIRTQKVVAIFAFLIDELLYNLEALVLSRHFHLFALEHIWIAQYWKLESFRTFAAFNLYTLLRILHYLTTILTGWLGGNVASLFVPGHLFGILFQVATLTRRLGWYMMSLLVPGTFSGKILANFTCWFGRYMASLFEPR